MRSIAGRGELGEATSFELQGTRYILDDLELSQEVAKEEEKGRSGDKSSAI